MSNAKAMSFKARINKLAKSLGIRPQTVIVNFMFERFLERLSRSRHKEFFVIKGGVLVSAMVGLRARATMDIDTTVVKMKMSIPSMRKAITEIVAVDVSDEVDFKVLTVERIRLNADGYGGIRVKLEAAYCGLRVPFAIDVTGGDSLVPPPTGYEYKCLFTENLVLGVQAYAIETVLAEKCEAILQRNVVGTRPRDYYDVYILSRTQKYDPAKFQEALLSTCRRRGTEALLGKRDEILSQISSSAIQRKYWSRYQTEFPYAKTIEFADAVTAVAMLLDAVC